MTTFAVIGLGQLGASVATQLAERGAEVIAIDSDPMRVEQIKDQVARAMSLDATDEKALRAAGVADCDTVILALGEAQLEEAVLITMALRELGVGRIVSRASSDIQARLLLRLGVTRVVFPERQIG
ncbi:MAG: TrkA family potassium uptake protein, partial [Myxococcota bacterium]